MYTSFATSCLPVMENEACAESNLKPLLSSNLNWVINALVVSVLNKKSLIPVFKPVTSRCTKSKPSAFGLFTSSYFTFVSLMYKFAALKNQGGVLEMMVSIFALLAMADLKTKLLLSIKILSAVPTDCARLKSTFVNLKLPILFS